MGFKLLRWWVVEQLFMSGERQTAARWCTVLLLTIPLTDTALAESIARWTTYAGGEAPFQQPLLQTDDDALDRVMLGRSFFTVPWVAAPASTTARDGLGPLFNANTCASCHHENGSAATVSEDGEPLRPLLFKLAGLAAYDDHSSELAPTPGDPVYGTQLAINATGSVLPEAQTALDIETVEFTYPDGQSIELQRFTPQVTQLAYGPLGDDTVMYLRQPGSLAGLGLIERVSDAEILTWEDPEDTDYDGISGRANRMPSGTLGRFGWKATEPDLHAQIAFAAASDMGLTNSLYAEEACQPAQIECLAAPRGRPARGQTAQVAHDLTDQRLQALTDYVASFKAPHPGTLDEQATLGSDTFDAIGCADCHRTSLQTQDGLILNPGSDFLLHDMGDDLSDGVHGRRVEASEFRTAPLWGLGARLREGHRFLHDARARVPEEAILWHGGEAATSRDRFVNLNARLRAAVLHYLYQL